MHQGSCVCCSRDKRGKGARGTRRGLRGGSCAPEREAISQLVCSLVSQAENATDLWRKLKWCQWRNKAPRWMTRCVCVCVCVQERERKVGLRAPKFNNNPVTLLSRLFDTCQSLAKQPPARPQSTLHCLNIMWVCMHVCVCVWESTVFNFQAESMPRSISVPSALFQPWQP